MEVNVTPFPVSNKAILLRNEPLAPLTSFRIGGPAELLLLPATVDDVRSGVEFARRNNLRWRVMGSGTNVLIPDDGLPGLTIKFWRKFAGVNIDATTLTAQAGATMWEVSKNAADAGLGGLEFGCGIPGTVGGAVFMNAGVREAEIKDILDSALILECDGRVETRQVQSLELGYRSSALQRDGGIVLTADFSLHPGEPEKITAEMNRFLEERRQRQPLDQPNCGSVFRNPPGDYAGRMLEVAGCKGLRCGGAFVSELHANFIINSGNATAKDVISIIDTMRKRVYKKMGVRLEPEMRILE